MKHFIRKLGNFCASNAKKCASFVLACGLVSGAAIAQTYWQYGPQNKSSESKAYFPINNCINMGNGLNAPHEGDWSFTFEESNFSAIKSVGFDTVRIPIRWSLHISDNAPYTIDPTFLARVDTIISWALKYNLNVIIDVHDFEELYENPDKNEVKLLAIWGQLSYHYAKAPQNLIFEIINEPKDNFSGARVNKTQFNSLSLIRRHNPTRTVILAGDAWGGMGGMDNLRLPPNDPYVVATVHYYSPFEFTHQGAEWMGDKAPPKGRNWPNEGELQSLNDDITKIYKWRDKLGVQVFVGEYGTDLAVPEHLRADWAYYTTKGFKAAKLPTCYFNFASGFAIYDPKTKQWKENHLKAIGLK